MRVRYTTTLEDLVALNQFHADTSPTIARLRKRIALSVSATALGLGVLADLVGRTVFWTPLAALFVVLFLFQYRKQHAPTGARITRDLAAEGQNATVLCEHTLEVTPEVLIERTPVSESRTTWRAIERVARSDTHAFIFTQPLMAHIVPRWGLAEGDFDAFVGAVEAEVAKSRGEPLLPNSPPKR